MTQHTLRDPAATAVSSVKDSRRASLGSYIGATLEWYDFILYSTAAALIFPTVFFGGIDPVLGAALSYATLAGGYIVRPLGAIVFGHFGDRLGRKRMLVLTMVLMGVASIGIGLTPGSDMAGPAAAVVLVALRLLQGIAVGGEWAGASLMSIEHARPGRRGFAGALVQSGGPSGSVLATLAFGLVSLMPNEQLMSWGWRLPFLASAVVVILAIAVRMGVKESPEFVAAEQSAERPRVPLFSTFAENWKSVLVIVLTALSPFFLQSVTSTFGLQFAIASGHPQPVTLWMLSIANFVSIFATLTFAALSDRLGRVRIMVTGFIGTAALAWVAFGLLGTANTWAVLAAFILLLAVGNAMVAGPLAAYMAELFPVRNRFTGVGVSYQLAATVAAGFAPLIATTLVSSAGGGTTLLTSFMTLLAAIGVGAALLSRRVRVA